VKELHVYAPKISVCNSERMAKIGAELGLLKLSQKIKLGIRFLDHPVCANLHLLFILCT